MFSSEGKMACSQCLQCVAVVTILRVLCAVVSAAAAGPPAEVKVFGMQLDTWAPPLPDVVVTYNLSLNIPQVIAVAYFSQDFWYFTRPSWLLIAGLLLTVAIPPVHSRKKLPYVRCLMEGEFTFIYTFSKYAYESNSITSTIKVTCDKGRRTLTNHGIISDLGLSHGGCPNYLLILTVLLRNAT